MKQANRLIKREDREGLADMGYADEDIQRLIGANASRRVGFPNYVLKNNSANIRRLEKRLAEMQLSQIDETTEEQFDGGIRLVENVEENRLQIFFPGVSAHIVRRELKQRGFRWAPSVGAWQRHRSNRATYLAKLLLQNHSGWALFTSSALSPTLK
jgi:hypothetical protein